ncbi:sugar-binding transcriptional regulator [Latilactobacillus curvatus]|uniref:sugar-binding transcriptional regulator n=1 Tax=Latilactobacillus curvatus TaxID=28038 RepID=UPI0007EBB604|nr:sugar-binding domain-containing protein [Latilactobacillus curvatus]ANJ69028.1 SorC family transcriptional regulator [Latilactobacillus curvatus]
MRDELSAIEAVAPDFVGIIKKRYQVLQHIDWLAPVGRRTLAEQLKMSERIIRTETDFLKAQGLLNSSKSGMVLTVKGNETLDQLRQVMDQFLGLHQTERQLSQVLGIEHCLIVSGNSDEQPKVLTEMGKLVNSTLQLLLPQGQSIVAVMGGTTMAEAAHELSTDLSKQRNLIFVPARGGIGESVDIQANAVCAEMAKQTGGKHRALYVPEQVSEKTYAPLLEEPSVQEVLKLIERSRGVLHSIGEAIAMAERREMPIETIKMLKEKHAVGEAFGYFFNAQGEVVYKIPRIGLQIRDLLNIPCVLAVASGASKAQAIQAYMHLAPKQTWLITDEGAANSILQGATL